MVSRRHTYHWRCKREGQGSHRWGRLQIQWTHRCFAAYREPNLSSVGMGDAGSGGKKQLVSGLRRRKTKQNSRTPEKGLQLPVGPPCTPFAVLEEREDPGCFWVLRNSSYPGSIGTAHGETENSEIPTETYFYYLHFVSIVIKLSCIWQNSNFYSKTKHRTQIPFKPFMKTALIGLMTHIFFWQLQRVAWKQFILNTGKSV